MCVCVGGGGGGGGVGAFLRVLLCLLSYCCVKWILSCIVITLLGRRS